MKILNLGGPLTLGSHGIELPPGLTEKKGLQEQQLEDALEHAGAQLLLRSGRLQVLPELPAEPEKAPEKEKEDGKETPPA